MAIEGPLRELGLHDVFQLLDLSRKTGILRVTSDLRGNEGKVYFEAGHVIYASMHSNPHALGTMLVRSGRLSEEEFARARTRQLEVGGGRRLGQVLVEQGLISARELDRQLRLQVEAVVFELLSWREGLFSFSEQRAEELDVDATVRIATESLLMEAARRLDEWTTIGDYVQSLDEVPTLAPLGVDGDEPVALRAEEWELLSAVDGQRDLRGVAGALGASEFDVAKLAAHMVKAGILAMQPPPRALRDNAAAAVMHVEHAHEALRRGATEEALDEARLAIASDPGHPAARLVAARTLQQLGRVQDALDEMRRAAQFAPDDADVQRELGFAAARVGRFVEALQSWDRYLQHVSDPLRRGEHAVREARAAVERLHALLEDAAKEEREGVVSHV